jgi:hypothetical protein
MGKKQEIRRKFREAVFKRDGFRCKVCNSGPYEEDSQSVLDAHHITNRDDMPGGGYVPENGISLCTINLDAEQPTCHEMAEFYHISGGKEWSEGMHPDDLYKMIGSSKELAIKKSNERFTDKNKP